MFVGHPNVLRARNSLNVDSVFDYRFYPADKDKRDFTTIKRIQPPRLKFVGK
jgi:hypothetical protein